MINQLKCNYCRRLLDGDDINYLLGKFLCSECRDYIELNDNKDMCDTEWLDERKS